MKMLTPILNVIAVVLLAMPAHAQEAVLPELKGEAASGQRLKELQKERGAVLREIAEASLKLAQRSRIEPGVAAEDFMTLLDAELDVVETESERIDLYKQTLIKLTEFEQLARAEKEAARGNELAILRIKARRLEVEGRLERLKAKEQAKIVEIQKERIATLKMLVEGTEAMFKAGRTSSEELYEARLLLLEGEMEVANTDTDRISLFMNVVEVLKEYEKHADSQRANIKGTDDAAALRMLKVMARRLDAEIQLERAKTKESREGLKK